MRRPDGAADSKGIPDNKTLPALSSPLSVQAHGHEQRDRLPGGVKDYLKATSPFPTCNCELFSFVILTSRQGRLRVPI